MRPFVDADREGMSRPTSRRRRFHVDARSAGSGGAFGTIGVNDDRITYTPSWIGRHFGRASGCLTHTDRRVVVVVPRLGLGFVYVILRQADDGASLRWSPWIGRPRDVSFSTALLYPWQRRAVLGAIEGEGFDLVLRPRWMYFGFGAVE